MKHIDLLLPFGLPHKELAADLLRTITTPALATLIARANSRPTEEFDEFSRALPHEHWLARQFGMAGHMVAHGSPPVAIATMQALGLQAEPGTWFMLHPVHIHIARDHLVLTDIHQLALAEQESRALFDVAKSLFDEAGKTLLYGDARTWFVRADDWHALKTSTPDAACGHNIDIWMPKGDGDRAWRKLQNDVQMHWHSHTINAEREMRGVKPVNSLWLWGGTPTALETASGRYAKVCNPSGWIAALAHLAQEQSHAGGGTDLIVCDTLIEPALAGDWSEWLARFHLLENDWFSPTLDSLKAGKIDRIGLIATHNSRLAEFAVTRHSLRKFWIKPSLKKLAP